MGNLDKEILKMSTLFRFSWTFSGKGKQASPCMWCFWPSKLLWEIFWIWNYIVRQFQILSGSCDACIPSLAHWSKPSIKGWVQILEKIAVESGYDVNAYEKLSIWTLISLTHDLGYPLQKAIEVIERTKSMMYSFVSNPMVTMDLSFSGVQSSMNDFVLRFISSRMWE